MPLTRRLSDLPQLIELSENGTIWFQLVKVRLTDHFPHRGWYTDAPSADVIPTADVAWHCRR